MKMRFCLVSIVVHTAAAFAPPTFCTRSNPYIGTRASVPTANVPTLEKPATADARLKVAVPNAPIDNNKYLQGVLGAVGVVTASSLVIANTLPQQSEYWSLQGAQFAPVPLCTMLAMGALVVAAHRAFGTDLHPIIARARDVEPAPKALTFQVLGLSGVLVSAAAIAFSWYPIPVAGTFTELAHCALPFLLWKADAELLRALNPHVEWAEGSTSLVTNYRTEHDSPIGAGLALLGVAFFELYVQQLLASPLSQAGWPLLGSAVLIALNAGLLNHALANGVKNGFTCLEFYWTVSLMFGLSNSIVPVAIFHHLMYSMPVFSKGYDQAIERAPIPTAQAALLHGTLMAWHLALFSALSLVVPPAMELLPSVPTGLSLTPVALLSQSSFGLVCLMLFSANTAGVIVGAMKDDDEEEVAA